MSNIALQIERLAGGNVDSGSNVIFDNIVYSSGNISYNSGTGVITFNEAGRYVLDWWVATQTSTSPSFVVFTAVSSQGDNLEGIYYRPLLLPYKAGKYLWHLILYRVRSLSCQSL